MKNVLIEKEKYTFGMKLDIRWSDMDEMCHVNNAVYLTYFEQGRIYYLLKAFNWNWQEKGLIQASANIEYIRPLIFPDPARIYVRTSKISNRSFTLDYMITSLVQDEEMITTLGNTTMVLFDYKTNKSMLLPEEFKEEIKSFEREYQEVLD